ncbi:MAG: DUF1566 domain-containing protein [Muribaculaceae bacterium]
MRIFWLLLVVGLVFASCKDDKDDSTDTTTEVVNYDLTLYASEPSENNTTLTEGWNWKSGDQLAFVNLAYTRDVVRLTNNGSSFSGSVASVSSSVNMGFFYPASAVTQLESDTTYVKLSYARQDGVNVPSYLAGASTATIDGTKAESIVTMNVINAAANLKINCDGAPINDITHIELYSDKGALQIDGNYELKSLAFTSVHNGNISVVNAGLNGEARVGLFPSNGVRLGVTVITANGDTYVGLNKTVFNIVAGEVYNLEFDCQKQDEPAKIGDYFYSDFTHSSEYDNTKTCVGVVFALCDKEDGDINPSLTSSSHGRIVSLTDVGKYSWSFTSVKVIDIPRITNYANVDGSNAYGYLPFHVSGGTMGYYEEADVKISASLKADGTIDSWPSAGALSDFEGLHNTESVDSGYNKYPAAYYAARCYKGGLSSWYLPSAGEMSLVYALYRSGVIKNQTDFVALTEFGYWTSSECTEQKAWVLQVFDGKLYANFKMSSYMVRPVLAF